MRKVTLVVFGPSDRPEGASCRRDFAQLKGKRQARTVTAGSDLEVASDTANQHDAFGLQIGSSAAILALAGEIVVTRRVIHQGLLRTSVHVGLEVLETKAMDGMDGS